MNPHIEPKRPDSRRRLSRVLVASVMGASVFAGVAHLTSPSVVAGEHNTISATPVPAPTLPMAISDSELFRREAGAVLDQMIANRRTGIEEPDTRGAPIAAYAR